MPYVLAVLALIMLVVLHELGHFLAARAVGIRATKFYVFFPPAVYRRQVGDVEFGIGALPLGGFVKLPGMFRPEAGEVAERLRWEYESVLPLAGGEARLQLDAARRDVAHATTTDELREPLEQVRDTLDELLEATSDRDAERTLRTTRERVGALLDDLHPLAYWRGALWRRMTVIAAGPAVNLLVAFLVLAGFYWMLVPRYEISSPLRIDEVSEGSPAAQAGLTTDSVIEAWDGPIVGVEPVELAERIQGGLGEPVTLTWVDEDGERRTERIVPARYDDDVDEPRLGILPAFGGDKPLDVEVVGRRSTDPVTGMRIALLEMREITVGTFTRLPRVFFDSEVREDVGSVVGIVQVAQDVDRAGQFVRYIAIISLVLAVMNLLPLLPLDGGHLLFGLLEAIRRRPMPRAAFERYSMVGLALVLILFFIGLDNDITRARSD
jgi:regulator of sigma E protease